MSWHFKFYAADVQQILDGINTHIDKSKIPNVLATKMMDYSRSLFGAEGIGWIVESYGSLGSTDGANFTFKVEPINNLKNDFYRRSYARS